ncbi:MAG: MTH1187 family thiamine-binding protein [Dehalococcoidia bacterium]|nr:MTH1187 family thiamine-binding protein [Dehalococcoidia bacterium]
MAVAEVSIVPIGTKTTSVSKYVVAALKALRKEKKVVYELTSMGTILEGELDDVLRAAKKMHEGVLAGGVRRVVTTIKIDDRRDKPLTMSGKVESVVRKLQQ